MSNLTTVNVAIILHQILGGAPVPRARLRFELTGPGVNAGLLLSPPSWVTVDDSGLANAALVPNVNTQTIVTVYGEHGAQLAPPMLVTVPAYNCNLHDLVNLAPPATLDDAQRAVDLARDYANKWTGDVNDPANAVLPGLYSARYWLQSTQAAGAAFVTVATNWAQFTGGDVPGVPGSRSAKSWSQDDLRGVTYGGSAKDWAMGAGLIDGAYNSARTYSLAAAGSATAADASRQLADADKAQTALDRVQTGSDKTNTAANLLAAQGYMLTATAQASLATVQAAAASSVAQQDLSGVVDAALHRGPNPVIGFVLIDPSRDSNPAWVQQCDNASWANRALNGNWLGAFASEIDARYANATFAAELVVNGDNEAALFTFGTATSPSGGTVSRVIDPAGVFGNTMALTCDTVTSRNHQITFTGGVAQIPANTAVRVSGRAFVPAGGVATFKVYDNSDGSWFGNAAGITQKGQWVNFDFTRPPKATVWVLGFGNNSNEVLAVGAVAFHLDNLSVKLGTGTVTKSGDYFQNFTDGRYYRLWRNMLAASQQDTGWAPAGVSPPVVANTQTWQGKSATKVTFPSGTAGGFAASRAQCSKAGPIWGGVQVASSLNVSLSRALSGSEQISVLYTGTQGLQAVNIDSTNCAAFVNAWNRATGVFTPTVTGSVSPYVFVGQTLASPLDVYVCEAQHQIGAAFDFYEATDAAAATWSASAGVSETFDGNTNKLGRVVIVLEASRWVGYAIDLPGRPMWLSWVSSFGNMQGAAYREGVLRVACANGIVTYDFAKDFARFQQGGNDRTFKFLDRALTSLVPSPVPAYIANSVANAVDMTTLSDAPTDPATGLRVPTALVGTGAGLSLMHNDGSVVNTATSAAFTRVSITPYMLSASNGNAVTYYATMPGKLAAGWTINTPAGQTPGSLSTGQLIDGSTIGGRSTIGVRGLNTPRISFVRVNEANFAASPTAQISDTSNSGHMVGDIRRCWAADTFAGATQGGNLFADGAFDGGSTAGWVTSTNFASTAAVVAGEFQVSTSSDFGRQVYALPTVPGRTYQLSGQLRRVSGSGNASLSILTGLTGLDLGAPYIGLTSNLALTSVTLPPFVATSATTYVGAGTGSVGAGASVYGFDNLVFAEVIADRGYKGKPLTVNGAGLVKTAVAVAAQLVAVGGFSGTSYAQEAYSADLDPGTGALRVALWGSLPTSIPAPSVFPVTGANVVPNSDFTGGSQVIGGITAPAGANWGTYTPANISASSVAANSLQWTATAHLAGFSLGAPLFGASSAKTYKFTVKARKTADANGTASLQLNASAMGWQVIVPTATPVGTFVTTDVIVPSGSSITLSNFISAASWEVQFVQAVPVDFLCAFDRSAAAGPYYRVGFDGIGRLVAEVSDGVATPRTVASTMTVANSTAPTGGYNTGQRFSLAAHYEPSGSLSLWIGPTLAAQATGTPLASLTNAAAVATLGNNRALTGAWPGDLALVKVGMTVPSPDACAWIYEQEKEMFRDGAQVTLPDSSNVQDLAYDDVTASWLAVSGTNESRFVGLVRVSTKPGAAGTINKISGRAGIRLLARTGANSGADITIPSRNAMEDTSRRPSDVVAGMRDAVPPMDWQGAFTANTLAGDARITVTGSSLALPLGATLVGAGVTGTGIPANTTVLAQVGTQLQLSAACTALGSGVTVSIKDLILPPGIDPRKVSAAGIGQQEGSGKPWQRAYDGFRSRVSFTTAPGNQWLQVEGQRA